MTNQKMKEVANTFKKDVKRGRAGEQVVANYLRSKGYKVEDVTEKFLTYDFFVYGPTDVSTIHSLEVKCQKAVADGKIVLEIEGKYGTDGWFIKGQADRYAFTQNDDIYFIRATDLMNAYLNIRPEHIHTKEGKVIAFMNIADITNYAKVAHIKVGE